MLSPKQCLVRGEVKIQTQALWTWYLSLYSLCVVPWLFSAVEEVAGGVLF